MTTTKRQPQYTPEQRERAVRMVLKHRKGYPSL
jgi:transposase-like protein